MSTTATLNRSSSILTWALARSSAGSSPDAGSAGSAERHGSAVATRNTSPPNVAKHQNMPRGCFTITYPPSITQAKWNADPGPMPGILGRIGPSVGARVGAGTSERASMT